MFLAPAIRIKKSYEFLKRLDFALYVVDAGNADLDTYKTWKREAARYNVNHVVVINKIDTVNKEEIDKLVKNFKEYVLVSSKDKVGIDDLKSKIIKHLEDGEEEKPLVGDLLEYGSKVVLVVPIDSEAPKGRIILPQVQVIRDCLDHGIKTYVVRDTELKEAMDTGIDIGKQGRNVRNGTVTRRLRQCECPTHHTFRNTGFVVFTGSQDQRCGNQ